MKGEFISVFIVFVLVLCFFLHYESKYSDLNYVKSKVDKEKYFIVTYELESETNLRDGAWQLAIGQSVITFNSST